MSTQQAQKKVIKYWSAYNPVHELNLWLTIVNPDNVPLSDKQLQYLKGLQGTDIETVVRNPNHTDFLKKARTAILHAVAATKMTMH